MKVLVCDDSIVARKAIVRSIVAEPNLTIVEASDGLEAIQILKEQNIDVLFLDLTMPVMDGFEVLTAFPVSKYPTKTVVVSGDVQKAAIERCLALGAIDFIAKPFKNEVAIPLFRSLGLQYYGAIAQPEPPKPIRVDPLVKFKEITNIALGKGAAIMADHFNEFIQLPVPQVAPLTYGELKMTMSDVLQREGSSAISQRFVGGGIHGEALVCLRGKDVGSIGEKMGYRPELTSKNEVIVNVANLLVSSFLTSLGSQIDRQFSLRQPAVMEYGILRSDSINDHEELLAIEYIYRAERLDFECEVLFMLDKPSLPIIYEIMECV